MTAEHSARVAAGRGRTDAVGHGGGISNPILGMLLFITSEVMFFAGLFAAYFNVRANAPQWPPRTFGAQPPDPAAGRARRRSS